MVYLYFHSLVLLFVSLVSVIAAPTATNGSGKPATTQPAKQNSSPGTTVAGRGPIYQQRAENINHLSDVAELYTKVIKINVSDKAKPVQVDFTALLGPDEDPVVSEELFHILHAEANGETCVTQMDEDFQQTKNEAPKISEKLTLEKIKKVGEALFEKMNGLKFPSDNYGRQSSSSDLVTAYQNKLKAGFILENKILALTAVSQKVPDYQVGAWIYTTTKLMLKRSNKSTPYFSLWYNGRMEIVQYKNNYGFPVLATPVYTSNSKGCIMSPERSCSQKAQKSGKNDTFWPKTPLFEIAYKYFFRILS
ncbi:hypothetical protein Ddc_19895 [Ditylenchus destructor]|nr:hypothetical protein Ddc_19895 [Ditylenchus destructor]